MLLSQRSGSPVAATLGRLCVFTSKKLVSLYHQIASIEHIVEVSLTSKCV